jgi:hypothetical protein
MKMLKTLILFFAVQMLFALSVHADEKYVMKSGDVYFGEKLSETETTIKLKEFDSGLTVEINKSLIEKTLPLLCSIETTNGYEIIGSIVDRTNGTYKITASDGVVLEIEQSQIAKVTYFEEDEVSWPVTKKTIQIIDGNQNLQLDKNDRKQEHPENYLYDMQVNQQYQNPNQLPDYYRNTYSGNFGYLGFRIGTPGLFNLAVGLHTKDLEFALLGGAGGELLGLQGSILFNLYTTENYLFSINAGICLGYQAEKKTERSHYISRGDIYFIEYYYTEDYFFTGAME